MPFQVCDNIVYDQSDTGVCTNLLRVAYGKHFIRNAIFKKCFQILEQSTSVYRIYSQNCYFLCHDNNNFSETIVLFSKFITFVQQR